MPPSLNMFPNLFLTQRMSWRWLLNHQVRDGLSNRPLPAIPAKMVFPWDVAKSLESSEKDAKSLEPLEEDVDASSKGEAGDTGDAKPVIDGEFCTCFIIV